MKNRTTLKLMLIAVLAAAVVLIGCKNSDQTDPDPDPSGEAELSSFKVGGKSVSLPTVITGDAWNGALNFNSLDGKYTHKITFAAAASLTVAIQAEAHDKATVEYAVAANASTKPSEDSFKSINGTVTLSSGSYLYIKVTAEDGTVNYYRFSIEQEAPPANKVVVAFDLDGGSPAAGGATIPSVTIDKGSSLGNNFPAPPTKTNYDFGGWFNVTEYTSTTIINASVTLTAKWTLKPAAVPLQSISLGKTSTTLTLYSTEQLTPTFTPANATYKTITWTSSVPAVASVDANGKITAASVTASLSEKYTVTPATGTAVITGTTPEGIAVTITVTTTVKPQAATVNTVPAMKDQFKNYFMMGNIAGNANDINGTGTTATRLKRHYNILTPENIMKPSYYGGSRSGTTVSGLGYNDSDAFVKACADNQFKVHAHVLLWHQQNSAWITGISSASKAEALGAMKSYITQVVTHFKGKIYSWDVLNEVFPDSVTASMDWKQSMRNDDKEPNPWYKSIGYEFVYEAYLAARLADPAAILYYNDFNTDMAGKAAMIRDMVRDVNAQYAALSSGSKPAGDPAGRLLIEGIGMQEHHNTGVSAAAIKATINLFRPLGVKLSVSELDVLCQGWSDYSSNPAKNTEANYPETSTNTVTNNGFIKAAQLYGEYMKLYIENKDIIERVALWGVIDSQSWRGRGLPLLFDKDGKAKPAYFKMIEALE